MSGKVTFNNLFYPSCYKNIKRNILQYIYCFSQKKTEGSVHWSLTYTAAEQTLSENNGHSGCLLMCLMLNAGKPKTMSIAKSEEMDSQVQ